MKTTKNDRPRYYKFIVKGNDKVGGVMFAPDDWPYPIAEDGVEVKNWESLVVELRDGTYRPFHLCIGGANMVSQELKELLESFIEDKDCIEFLPVHAKSKEYGDRTYYIMHFKKIFDVIDPETTIYAPGTNSVMIVRLNYDKVKNLNVFNTRPHVSDVIVSAEVRKRMKKQKLELGLEFMPIYCGDQITKKVAEE